MGKIRDQWKAAKNALPKDIVDKLPKMDFGPQLDSYETLCGKISMQISDLETNLDEWYKQYLFMQQKIFPHYIKEIPAKETAANDHITEMLRQIRAFGAKTHGEWEKLKQARISELKF